MKKSSKLFLFTLPILPIVATSSAICVVNNTNNEKEISTLNSNISTKDASPVIQFNVDPINLSTNLAYQNWPSISYVPNKHNDEWSKDFFSEAFSDSNNNTFSYNNVYQVSDIDATPIPAPTNEKQLLFRLLIDTVNWSNMFSTKEEWTIAQKQSTFIINGDPIVGINGGVLLNYKLIINLNDKDGKPITPSTSNGLIKSNTAIFTGFKPYVKADSKWNNCTVEVKKTNNKFSYNDFPNGLPNNFLSLSANKKQNALKNFVKSNWSWILNISNGVYSIDVDTVSNDEIFSKSLNDFVSEIGEVSGLPSIDIDDSITFTFIYPGKNEHGKNDLLVKRTPTSSQISLIDTTFTPTSSGLSLNTIIGIAFCIGGGAILLIAMIILLIKKSKASKEEDESHFQTISFIPNEHTGYLQPEHLNLEGNNQRIALNSDNSTLSSYQNFEQTQEYQDNNLLPAQYDLSNETEPFSMENYDDATLSNEFNDDNQE